jgi:hypothetical protein
LRCARIDRIVQLGNAGDARLLAYHPSCVLSLASFAACTSRIFSTMPSLETTFLRSVLRQLGDCCRMPTPWWSGSPWSATRRRGFQSARRGRHQDALADRPRAWPSHFFLVSRYSSDMRDNLIGHRIHVRCRPC